MRPGMEGGYLADSFGSSVELIEGGEEKRGWD